MKWLTHHVLQTLKSRLNVVADAWNPKAWRETNLGYTVSFRHPGLLSKNVVSKNRQTNTLGESNESLVRRHPTFTSEMKWSRAPLKLRFFFKKKRIFSVLDLAPSPPNSAGGGAGLGPQLNLHTCVSWLLSHKLHGCCAGGREQINTKSLHSLG